MSSLRVVSLGPASTEIVCALGCGAVAGCVRGPLRRVVLAIRAPGGSGGCRVVGAPDRGGRGPPRARRGRARGPSTRWPWPRSAPTASSHRSPAPRWPRCGSRSGASAGLPGHSRARDQSCRVSRAAWRVEYRAGTLGSRRASRSSAASTAVGRGAGSPSWVALAGGESPVRRGGHTRARVGWSTGAPPTPPCSGRAAGWVSRAPARRSTRWPRVRAGAGSAVRAARVFAATAAALFHRPGPRLMEALEALAKRSIRSVPFRHEGRGWRVVCRRGRSHAHSRSRVARGGAGAARQTPLARSRPPRYALRRDRTRSVKAKRGQAIPGNP